MNCCTEEIITTGANAGFGYMAAALFTSLDPVAGAIFGASAGLAYSILNPLIERIPDEWLGGCGFARLAKAALAFFASIFVGAVVTSLCGYPITLLTGMILTLSTAATTMAIACLYNYWLTLHSESGPGKTAS